jgi:hypothetical protein
MEDFKKKIIVLINQEFMKNYFNYKEDLKQINTRDELVLWINNNRHLFNIYFRKDLDKILDELVKQN